MSATQSSWEITREPMRSCNCPFPWMGARSPVTVRRQLFTGRIKSRLTPLRTSGLTMEMLLPVSTVISQGLPWMVPETVKLSLPPCFEPVLKMSNSLGAVDGPAKLCPASSANCRFPDGKLLHWPAGSSATEDILASGDLSHCTPSKSGNLRCLTCAAILRDYGQLLAAVAVHLPWQWA